MSEIGKQQKLFEAFPPVSTQAWEEKIIADLKGADYERKLVWKTNEGFQVRPYYRAENLDNLKYLQVMPGQFPFVRGKQTNKNSWYIRQDVVVTNTADANKKATDAVAKGANSIGFVFTDKEVPTARLAELLKGIDLAAVEINFSCKGSTTEFVQTFIKFVKDSKTDVTKVRGSVGYDPITCIAKNGKYCSADPMGNAITMVKLCKELPNFKAITVKGYLFEDAGSSISQELGFSLAVANEYMAGLTDAGISADDAAKAIKFHFAVGSNYFMELAKVRAARVLWAQIVAQYKPANTESGYATIHAETSSWNKTVYDSYVNMLRTQTEAMSAILGGVDSFTVKPFNAAYQQNDEFGDRVARNQQILLKEEAHFDKVVDPGAGSYYIENLTDSIAEQAWKLFIETEDKGGFKAAYKAGFVQAKIKEMASKRDQDIANRREILLGVNQYPNFTESMKIQLASEVLTKPEAKGDEAEPLVQYRGAAAFEAMRYKTDLFAEKNKRPLAFMLTIGNKAMSKARAQFACNFFACAGFSVQDNNGFKTAEEGVKAAQASKAEIIVVCSSDEEYAQFAPEVKQLAGNAIVVVAGFPKDIMDALKAAGIENFIHVKSNVLETLQGYQKLLGIK
jgi:methylmalonyl-CoA mutase